MAALAIILNHAVLLSKFLFFSNEQQKQSQNILFHAEGLKDEMINFKCIS